MLQEARYVSLCHACQRAIQPGDRISTEARPQWLHAACSAEGKAALVKTAASKAIDAPPDFAGDMPCPDGLEFLPYQRGGIAYCLARLAAPVLDARGPYATGGVLLGDEMGLGKTVQAIGVINATPEIKTVLVVCPASLKLNWRNELRRWLTRDLSVGVFGHGVASLRGTLFDITIVSYDVLSSVTPIGNGRTHAELLDSGVTVPASGTWDLLVIDEIQYLKNPKAARSVAVAGIRRRCKRVLGLSGTPIPNKPLELWPILQMIAPEEWDPAGVVKGQAKLAGEGAGFFKFVKRFCDARQKMVARGKLVWTFDGATNLPELQDRLRASCMVRRLKADVLKELPPKRRQVIPVGNGVDDESDFGDLGDDFETASRKLSSIPFTELSRTRHRQALSKVKACLEHITTALEESETSKIVVFAHHGDVIDKLVSGLADYGVVSLVGDDSITARSAAVERFQTDPACRVFVGSLKAAGVGLTLTASSHVVFVELDWVPAALTQGEDRCHRIGQRESVLVQHLVLEGSIDAKMARFVTEKQNIADMALDLDTIPDVSGRPVVSGGSSAADPTLNPAPVPQIPAAEVAQIHADLRTLASVCDGAVAQDGQGFNGLDSNFGRCLAALPKLSLRQAAAARKMLTKYRKQLGRTA